MRDFKQVLLLHRSLFDARLIVCFDFFLEDLVVFEGCLLLSVAIELAASYLTENEEA